MSPNATLAAEVKQQCHESAKLHARTLCANKGIYGEMADAMVAGMKPPLVGFTDGFHVYFYGVDGKVVQEVVTGIPVRHQMANDPASDEMAIDTRVWNEALDKLTQAGHAVSMTSVSSDNQ